MAKKKTTKKATKKAAKKTTKSVAKKTTKKKAAKKTTRKKKSTEPIRYRLIWGVYSSGMREESRFDYGKRKDADKKAEQLKSKGKKIYWVQPIKEPIVLGEDDDE